MLDKQEDELFSKKMFGNLAIVENFSIASQASRTIEMLVIWHSLAWKQDGWPPVLSCFMKIYDPKNNFRKFWSFLIVEIYSYFLLCFPLCP